MLGTFVLCALTLSNPVGSRAVLLSTEVPFFNVYEDGDRNDCVAFLEQTNEMLPGVCIGSSASWPSSSRKLVQIVPPAGHRIFLEWCRGATFRSMCFQGSGWQIGPPIGIMVALDCNRLSICHAWLDWKSERRCSLDGTPTLILLHGLQSVCECSRGVLINWWCLCVSDPSSGRNVSYWWCHVMCPFVWVLVNLFLVVPAF